MPRSLELLIVLLAAPLWLPLLGILILLVAAIDGRPVFFRQVRPGLHARPFTILKFRTMRPGTESDAARTTRLGAFLRRTFKIYEYRLLGSDWPDRLHIQQSHW